MKKRNLILNTAVAMAFCAVAAPAMAASAFSKPAVALNYAVESFPSQGTIVIPSGRVEITCTAATDCQAGNLSVTLSAGTFASAPVATVTGTIQLASTVATLSADKRTAMWTVSLASAAGDKVTLSSFSVDGVGGQLSTAGNTLTISGSSIVSGAATAIGTAATAALATSAASATITNTGSTATTVDVANGGAGTVFRVGSTNSNVAALATFGFTAPAGVNVLIDGATTLGTALGDTATATMTGDFTAMSSVYLITSGSCTATAPAGAITGTITGTGVSFANLQAGTGANYTVCAVANGTSVITAGSNTSAMALPTNVKYTYIARTAGTTTYTPNPTSSTVNSNTIAYNGAAVNVNYMVGNGAGYAMYMNVVNPMSASAPVYITVRKANGTIKNGTLATNLGANSSQLFTLADINAATGAALNTESDRAAVTVFSPAAIRVTNFMLNPGNAVTQIGQSF